MLTHKSKRIKQTVNGFFSGAKNLVHPRDESSSSRNRRSHLLKHVEAKAQNQRINVCPIRFTQILLLTYLYISYDF
jgi:hypothetical protein